MSILVGSAADIAGVSVDGAQEAAYVAKVLALSPIAYWTLGEHQGTVAYDLVNPPVQNGTHVGVTLGSAGIGDGQTSPYYDGAASYTDVYSATLAAAFDGTVGTLAIWHKVANAGVWTDGTIRVAVQMFADADNFVRLARSNVNTQAQYIYRAGATTKQREHVTASPLTFFHMAITWDSVADEVIAYYDGVQSGATLTGLGAWAGALASVRTMVGANTQAGGNVAYGYLGHCALWDSVLTPAQILSLATV